MFRLQRDELFHVWDLGPAMTSILPFALVRRWMALVDPAIRRAVIAADLQEIEAASLARFFEYVLDHRDQAAARCAYLDTVIVMFETDAAVRSLRRDVTARLAQSSRRPVFAFLSDAPDGRKPATSQERAYDFEEVPSGVRKARARRPDLDTLMRITADPDPAVIRILLENPKATEDHAVRVAALRPQTPGNFLEVLRSRFGTRERVQAALVENPFCPVRLAVALTPLLLRSRLEEIQRASLLDERVREAARCLLEENLRDEKPPPVERKDDLSGPAGPER